MTDVRINVPPRLIEAARAAQYANRAKISNKERLEQIKKGIAVQAAQQQKKNNALIQKREGGQLEFTRKKGQKIWTRRRNLDRGFVIKAKDYQDTLLPVEVQNIFEGKNYAFSANIDLPFVGVFFDPVYVFADQRFNIDNTTGYMSATKTMPMNFSGTIYASDGLPISTWNLSGSKNIGEIIFFPLKSGYLTKYELLPVRETGSFPIDFFTATSYKNSNGEERRYIEENSPGSTFGTVPFQNKNFFELEEFIRSDFPMTLEAKVQLGHFPSPAYAPAPKYVNDDSGRYNQTYFSITSPLFGFRVEIGIDVENFRTDAWLLRELQYTPNDLYYYFQGSHELHIAYVYYKNRVQGFLDGSLFFDTKPLSGDIFQAQVLGLFPIVIKSESYYINIDDTTTVPSVYNRNYTPSPECCAIFKGFRCTIGRALYTDTFTPPESITSLI